jgi:hypothetical protein
LILVSRFSGFLFLNVSLVVWVFQHILIFMFVLQIHHLKIGLNFLVLRRVRVIIFVIPLPWLLQLNSVIHCFYEGIEIVRVSHCRVDKQNEGKEDIEDCKSSCLQFFLIFQHFMSFRNFHQMLFDALVGFLELHRISW